jgi:hypothetical protein
MAKKNSSSMAAFMPSRAAGHRAVHGLGGFPDGCSSNNTADTAIPVDSCAVSNGMNATWNNTS